MARQSEVGGHFAANLRRARRRSGISQEALGERAGLHRTEVGLLERGERVPRIDTLVKLAGALGVDAAVLLEGIGWNEGSATTTPGAFSFTEPSRAAQLVREGRRERDEQIDRALRGES